MNYGNKMWKKWVYKNFCDWPYWAIFCRDDVSRVMITKCDFAECTKIVLLRMTFWKRSKSFVMVYGLKTEKKWVYNFFCDWALPWLFLTKLYNTVVRAFFKKKWVYKNFLKIVHFYKNTRKMAWKILKNPKKC